MGLVRALLSALPVVAVLAALVCASASAGNPRQRTVADVTDAYGARVEAKFKPIAKRAGVAWPPRSITLLAFKAEKRLEVWTKDAAGKNRKLAEYPILAASGAIGPKRREGDRQVPEGFYKMPSLNPNSQYHLSIKVDYLPE